MSDLGHLLRKARMEKGISLDDLQETTKIRKAYLEAIEEGNYKKLPGNFYVRAFIKTYAESVGLEPGKVMNLYKNVIPNTTPEQTKPLRRKQTNPKFTDNISRYASTFLMISFVVLIICILYYFVWNNDTPSEVRDINSDQKITDQLPTTPATKESDNSNQSNLVPVPNTPEVPQEIVDIKPDPQITLVSSSPNRSSYSVEHADKLIFELSIIGDECWVEIIKLVDGARKSQEQGLFKNGQIQSWEIEGDVIFVVGKAVAANLKVNNQVIELGSGTGRNELTFELLKSE